MRVIIAAAGTGGHINPGIAIANKIKEEEPDSKIIFIGTNRGLENDLVPRAGYELKNIDSYGINRSISIDNIKRLYKTIKSIGEAKKIIKEFKPDVVIGTGGYICISVGIAAKKSNIPLILHESNAFPGMAVKILSKKADVVLTGFKEAKQRLTKAKKVVVTGTPTKVQKLNLTQREKLKVKNNLGFKEELPLIFAYGGSQGAKSINESLVKIIKEKKNKEYNILWATGNSGYDQIKEEFEKEQISINNISNAKIVPYIYNMEEILNTADLLVCRSGAMTITEISNVGKPAIFIPFPFATENHQEYNAKVLENVNAAKIIVDKNLNAENLDTQIKNIVNNPQLMLEMGNNANKVAVNDVQNRIYKEIINIKVLQN